jgi:hypothetical protein
LFTKKYSSYDIFTFVLVDYLIENRPTGCHNVIFPLQAKRVGEFIEIRHKKISPTLILSTLECLSLCDSVANKPPIISAACSVIGPKFFLRPFGQKSMSQKIFFWPRAGWAAAGGQKTSDFSGYLSYFTRHRSKNWNLGLKL